MPWLTISDIRSQVKQNRRLTPMYNLTHAAKQKPVYPPGEPCNTEGGFAGNLFASADSVVYLRALRLRGFSA